MHESSATALCILGATGSIGVSTLDVAKHLNIPVHTITGHHRLKELAQQARDFNVKRVVAANAEDYQSLKKLLADRPEISISAGPEALVEAAGDEHCSVVMTAIVGAAGLAPTLAAVEAGKRVGIANKEPLVMAGDLIMRRAKERGATLLPVDSEHSAIFQCLERHQNSENNSDIDRLILTASGGPFRQVMDLSQVTLAQALKHPNWDMGLKDHRRFRQSHEQGTRGDRSAPPLRHAGGTDRSHGAPAEYYPQHGGLWRWFADGAIGRAGYAHPHPICAHLATTCQWAGKLPRSLTDWCAQL